MGTLTHADDEMTNDWTKRCPCGGGEVPMRLILDVDIGIPVTGVNCVASVLCEIAKYQNGIHYQLSDEYIYVKGKSECGLGLLHGFSVLVTYGTVIVKTGPRAMCKVGDVWRCDTVMSIKYALCGDNVCVSVYGNHGILVYGFDDVSEVFYVWSPCLPDTKYISYSHYTLNTSSTYTCTGYYQDDVAPPKTTSCCNIQ